MKKLCFLILFISVNVLTFGANVYFLNDGIGYLYTNGQTFYSDQDGHALVAYHLWADPNKYVVDQFGSRFQHPDGSWSSWSALSNGYGSHECLKAGTWHAQGRVHVAYDIYGNSNYWMYTSFTLYFYVVDNSAPDAPQNPALSSATGQNGNVKVSWIANSEADIDFYEVWRKIPIINNNWYLIGTSTNSYFIDYEYLFTNPVGDFGLYYKVRVKDINSNYSNYSSEVSCRAEGANKKLFATGDALEYLLSQNFPNPFNPSTQISYKLLEDGLVNITVYNSIGQEVAVLVNQYQSEGEHVIQFNAEKLPSGIYIYKLRSGIFSDVKKMILTK